jgi:hypothetical protein
MSGDLHPTAMNVYGYAAAWGPADATSHMAPPELTEYGTPVHFLLSAAKTAASCQHIESDI